MIKKYWMYIDTRVHGGTRTIHKNWYAAASGPVAILFNASSPKQLIGGENENKICQ